MRVILLLLCLATLSLAQTALDLEKEEDRRDLFVVTGPAVLCACIGGVVGALTTAGVNECIGQRQNTVVIIREGNGEYRQARADETPTRPADSDANGKTAASATSGSEDA